MTESTRKTFADFNIPDATVNVLKHAGIPEPTEFQAQVLSMLMEEGDVFVQASSGSGTTLVAALATISVITESEKKPAVAFIVPDPDAAVQVNETMELVAKPLDIKGAVLHGGTPFADQSAALAENPGYITGTPAAILEHARHGGLDVSSLKVLILKDADRLMSPRTQDDLKDILGSLPQATNKWVFTGTLPGRLGSFRKDYLPDARKLYENRDRASLKPINHVYYLVDGGPVRVRQLEQVIRYEDPTSAVIFANTRDSVLSVAGYLQQRYDGVATLLEGMPDDEKEHTSQRCASGKVRFLVTTEADLRDMDLSHFDTLISYEFPETAESYLLRIRPPQSTTAFTKSIALISGQDLAAFRSFRLSYDIPAEEKPLPSADDLRRRLEGQRFDYLQSAFTDPGPAEFMPLVQRIMSHHRGYDIMAHVLSGFFADVSRAELRTPEHLRNKGLIVGLVDRRGREYRKANLEEPSRHPARERRNREHSRTDRRERKGDRGNRREHTRRRDEGVKLYVNSGRKHGFGHRALLELLENADIHPSSVIKTDARDHFSFVHVKPEVADAVISKLSGSEFRGRTLSVERAKH